MLQTTSHLLFLISFPWPQWWCHQSRKRVNIFQLQFGRQTLCTFKIRLKNFKKDFHRAGPGDPEATLLRMLAQKGSSDWRGCLCVIVEPLPSKTINSRWFTLWFGVNTIDLHAVKRSQHERNTLSVFCVSSLCSNAYWYFPELLDMNKILSSSFFSYCCLLCWFSSITFSSELLKDYRLKHVYLEELSKEKLQSIDWYINR